MSPLYNECHDNKENALYKCIVSSTVILSSFSASADIHPKKSSTYETKLFMKESGLKEKKTPNQTNKPKT